MKRYGKILTFVCVALCVTIAVSTLLFSFADAYSTSGNVVLCSDGFVKGLTEKSNLAVFQEEYANYNNLDYSIFNAVGDQVTGNNEYLGTGYMFIYNDGTADKMYTILVLADLNGNGEVDIDDYSRVKMHLRGKRSLSTLEFYAADVNEDGKVTATDYLRIKNYLSSDGSYRLYGKEYESDENITAPSATTSGEGSEWTDSWA